MIYFLAGIVLLVAGVLLAAPFFWMFVSPVVFYIVGHVWLGSAGFLGFLAGVCCIVLGLMLVSKI